MKSCVLEHQKVYHENVITFLRCVISTSLGTLIEYLIEFLVTLLFYVLGANIIDIDLKEGVVFQTIEVIFPA